MKNVGVLFSLFLFSFSIVFVSGCSPYKKCSQGFYLANMAVEEKGVSKKDGEPRGMTTGTHWVKGAGGFVRFKEKEPWDSLEVKKFYVFKFDCDGWVLSSVPSTVDSNYVIIGD